MQYQSTRDQSIVVSASEAIVRGLAPGGGLFVPQEFPAADLEAWRALPYDQLAAQILRLYLTDFDPDFLAQACAETYGAPFGGKAGQVARVADGLFALELWHGPTCAFKDYALQLMPKLLVQAKKNLGRTEKTRILVATSGDTGKAALAGYAGLDGIEIEVFYPNAGTSEIQRLQMATQTGDNVAVYAVEGNFDDAQSGVKRVFADEAAARELAGRGICLSSANSINWGRLAPQIVYYFYAYFRLVEAGAAAWGEPVDFCVPTGNFGDILAGDYARRMGLPVGRLVCASNKNNVLADFIRTGVYDKRREFYKTTSPSMDILISSNLERLLYHLTGSDGKVAAWMQELSETGSYTVDAGCLAALQQGFGCAWADDEAAARKIRELWQQAHYLCDPHTAVAFCAAGEQRTAAPMVVLSTASPFKFPRDVLAALAGTAPAGDFEAMAALTQATGCAAPESLRCLQQMPVRFTQVLPPEKIRAAALR